MRYDDYWHSRKGLVLQWVSFFIQMCWPLPVSEQVFTQNQLWYSQALTEISLHINFRINYIRISKHVLFVSAIFFLVLFLKLAIFYLGNADKDLLGCGLDKFQIGEYTEKRIKNHVLSQFYNSPFTLF